MLVRRNLPFGKALRTVKINRMAEGAITMQGNKVIETNINMVNYKVRLNIIVEGNFNMEVQQHMENTSLENLKEFSFTNNSKFSPLASMTFIHPVVRKLSTKEIQNVPLAGRLSQFVKQWEKKYTRPRNYVNSERISDTIHKSPSSGKASTIKMSKK